ncbi:MAG TPA: nitroreductase family protein [Actinophytocola sp.]|uniref:Acg family FMN-binding oxidoreductase n=1 Tax=Actinophytocola sp. TaxID=1872138 RepID=UPI002DB84DD7|nr:nitroreductase family protein [Actinophytocola sp.]HEU5471656.1 nitroreductase family protein [Actinophytocola sp.]
MTGVLDRETALAALELAACAPSLHNTQPWRFRVGAGSVELFADPTRRLPATDPDERDLLVSCGAVLHHLRVALAVLGVFATTTRLPDPDRPEHVATLEATHHTATHTDLEAAAAIPRRRSDRRAYGSRPVPDDRLAELGRMAAAQGTLLRVVRSAAARSVLVSAIAEADSMQRGNPSYVWELARWTGTRTGLADGVPSASVPAKNGYGDLPVRRFSAPRLHSPGESEQDGAGTLLVLGTSTDDRHARLRAGEALSAVLLAATGMGLATCPLSQPLELPEIRRVVRTGVLDDIMVPQLIVRVGWPPAHPDPFPRTRRRPVADMLDP